MAVSNIVIDIKIKWYAKPVIYFCYACGVEIPVWVFSFSGTYYK